MKKLLMVGLLVCFISSVSFADTFAEGTANELTIDFVGISGATNPSSGYGIVNDDYRMGMYEISNDQWNKFKNEYGTVTGSPSSAYDSDPYWTGTNVPTNYVSWYEAAQFVNWLNTSTGHQAAYKFIGTQGTSGYTFQLWQSSDNGYDASNPYRNSNAYYFLPTEDEWVKAAYWNGRNLQNWASVGGVAPTQAGWNFYDAGWSTDHHGPWDVGDGSQELNGTYEMMGNVWEWMESPYSGDYLPGSTRGIRGGSYGDYHQGSSLSLSDRNPLSPDIEYLKAGFRVASVPEPTSLVLLGLGGLGLCYRKR